MLAHLYLNRAHLGLEDRAAAEQALGALKNDEAPVWKSGK